jgi:hypothetical protein
LVEDGGGFSIPDVSEARVVRSPGADPDASPNLLIEVPHGATARRHYHALRRRLTGPFVDDLEAFFFVNTDVGSFETALRVAELVAERAPSPRTVLVVRSLVPRTFIDCNRVVQDEPAAGNVMTPAVPDYVTNPRDSKLLRSLHASYNEVAAKAFRLVCGAGSPALILHTYAPRSIQVERIDAEIVETLRRAYAPGRYETWPRRPDVDVISELEDGSLAAPRDLVAALRRFYARIDVEVAENATYRLVPATMGHVHSVRYPGRVLCMEINRELLAEPFEPFEEMHIGEDRVTRMAGPLADALLRCPPC